MLLPSLICSVCKCVCECMCVSVAPLKEEKLAGTIMFPGREYTTDECSNRGIDFANSLISH